LHPEHTWRSIPPINRWLSQPDWCPSPHRPARFGGLPSRPDLLQPGGRKAWRYASEVGLADIPCPSLAEQPGVRCLPQLGGESRATAGIAPCCDRGGALLRPWRRPAATGCANRQRRHYAARAG